MLYDKTTFGHLQHTITFSMVKLLQPTVRKLSLKENILSILDAN